jgi:hypothetical protein
MRALLVISKSPLSVAYSTIFRRITNHRHLLTGTLIAVIRMDAAAAGPLNRWRFKMARKPTRIEAFLSYGVRPLFRLAWSARSMTMVVVTLWLDEFTGPAGSMTYERRAHGHWRKGIASRLFFEDLAWAVGHLGGIVRVIVVVRDRSALPRVRVSDCYPARKLVMRITHLDPVTGAFRLEQVASTNMPRLVTAPMELVQAA